MMGVSAPEKNIRNCENSVLDLERCGRLAESDGKRDPKTDESRTLWLAVLQGLTIITKALRIYLRVERCERCGR